MKLPVKIFLIGFMGSGKSTLAKKLANRINYSFLDLDEEIERIEKRSVAEIFEKEGESYFRELETNLLNKLKTFETNQVIALGGGTPCFNNNMELIHQIGFSVYLKYNSGILANRLLNSKTKRPLITNKNQEELKAFIDFLLQEREQFYLKANLIIEGTNITAKQVIDLLFQNIEQ